jgi:hypothetical protein
MRVNGRKGIYWRKLLRERSEKRDENNRDLEVGRKKV